MNTIVINPVEPSSSPKIGDLYQNFNSSSTQCDKEIYILAHCGSGYIAINLQNGIRWKAAPVNTLSEAVAGLSFYKRNATITIT